MTYTILPLTSDPWQVFTLDLTVDGEPFHAQMFFRIDPDERAAVAAFLGIIAARFCVVNEIL